ncbi:MHS family MFS transporter [Corynebacterium testudinoris]|uniref:Putative proline/betaine transporter n=1 Tax=Corynebacterium testudinoris TaxID=136857 RepID=A0A0G3H5A0_9CORY|nr:MFS transporter [Corynebacterium testudinoris]AKK08581.1 Major Facilitator Superfamily transporter [Corynebacterium testudinoris]MBX8994792.1 MHS family MFS transporter [Corynebacterium testudinoris]
MTEPVTTPPRETKRKHARVLTAALSGSSIEWYDFFLYATASALIFNHQFFPTEDPFVSQMLSYLTLALTFFVRPFGGIIFSHFGDRVGRKVTLVVTLTMMGAATVAIGLIPTYDQIGIAAPILLVICRIIQGLAIGGEWGGAMLLAFENAPKGRRGFFGSVPQMGITIGMLLSSLAFAIVSAFGDEFLLGIGWRIPFIASIILVFVGLWIRSGLGETEDFEKARKSGDVAKIPLLETLTHHFPAVLVAVGIKVVETAPFYIFATFVASYATGTLDFERSTVLNAVSLGALASTIMIPIMGALSDRVGRTRVYVTGAVAIAAFAFPFFLLLDTGANWAVFAAVVIGLGVVWPPVTATLGTMSSEIFSPRIRYTGVTLGYQIGAALAGGTAPLIATWLLHEFNNDWHPIAIYIIIAAAISLLAVAFAPAIARREAANEAALEATNASTTTS